MRDKLPKEVFAKLHSAIRHGKKLDIEIAKKQNLDNPVFYLQYGHARLCALLRRGKEVFGLEPPKFGPSPK